jgi:A/G-specific adenine glycosylase
LLRWGRLNRRSFPWREEDDPFRVLVAEVLLQRSRSKTVAKVYRQLFSTWPSSNALASASVTEIAAVIRPLGLTSRAARLKTLAAQVGEMGGVPRDPHLLGQLPGVGRYAANATLAVAFDTRLPVVDGVTARVYRRYFGLSSDLPPVADRELWRTVESLVPRSSPREWNWAVLDLAASICMPKVPLCELCPLAQGCAYTKRRDPVSASC